MGLACSKDSARYAGVSVTTGLTSHFGQFIGDNLDKKRYPGPLGWELGMKTKTSPRKKFYVMKKSRRCFGWE
jgi:hypothetical protein